MARKNPQAGTFRFVGREGFLFAPTKNLGATRDTKLWIRSGIIVSPSLDNFHDPASRSGVLA